MHRSAKPSHYDEEAKTYDLFNEKSSQATNIVIEKILKEHNVKTVLDMTCGTGSQLFYLAKRGYRVVGSDISKKMLAVAKKKSGKRVKLLEGDIRTLQVGTFDAVLTIFNAVGHLTKADFAKAMRNVRGNLKQGGLYIFDINNLNFLLDRNNITTLTIDWKQGENRVIQYSTIDRKGILASFTTTIDPSGKVSKSKQTLQTYTAKQLKQMLEKSGFKVMRQFGIDGSPFRDKRSDRILMVAMAI